MPLKMLYHVTLTRSIPGIRKNGIKVSRAKGAPRVWLCTKDRLEWAYNHLAEHHDWDIGEMDHVRVKLPWYREQILKHPRKGVYFTTVDIEPEFVLPKGGTYAS